MKIREDLLKMHGFECIRGGSVPAPPSCRTLGRAMHRKAHHLALEEGPMQFLGVVSCCKSVKMCECLLKMSGFQCIGGGSVPPPPSCQTLGRAMRRKAHRLAFVQASMLFFCGVSRSQHVKIHEDLLKMRGFQCIGGRSVPPPLSCRTLGRAMRRKAHRLALAEAECIFLSCFWFAVCGKTRCTGKIAVAMQCSASHLVTL